VYQGFNLLTPLSARENIELPLQMIRWDCRALAVNAAALDHLGVDDRWERSPSLRLSVSLPLVQPRNPLVTPNRGERLARLVLSKKSARFAW
jgi:hypothetical protein